MRQAGFSRCTVASASFLPIELMLIFASSRLGVRIVGSSSPVMSLGRLALGSCGSLPDALAPIGHAFPQTEIYLSPINANQWRFVVFFRLPDSRIPDLPVPSFSGQIS